MNELKLKCRDSISVKKASKDRRPNVVFVLTDDQGYGDIGCHGNPYVKTPNLDRFAAENVEMTQFCVNPLCAPTRASMLTGRYYNCTELVSVWGGLSMMNSGEVTIAEALRDAGYRTAMYGKWHCGDNYPMRPMDQGFDETLAHKDGGLCELPNPRENLTYNDDFYHHNGKWEKYEGYCMDVYTDETLKFIERNKDEPFFVYLATNTPHTPLFVNDEYYEIYKDLDIEDTSKIIYGMVTNIDHNVKRLTDKLKELGLEENTIVIFTSDNGSSPYSKKRHYTAGFRGWKGEVYEGGIRVPCFISWPGHIKSGRKIDTMVVHFDIMPTILEACGAKVPDGVNMDGMSFMPLLLGEKVNWPDRTVFFEKWRMEKAALYPNFTARTQRYKLIYCISPYSYKDGFELYDILNDPGEHNDIAEDYPEIVNKLKSEYEAWFEKTFKGSDKDFTFPSIYIGSDQENPVELSPYDKRRVPKPVWNSNKHIGGHWEIKVVQKASYGVKFRFFDPIQSNGVAYYSVNDLKVKATIKKGDTECVFKNTAWPDGLAKLKAGIKLDEEEITPRHVDIERLD